MPHTWNPQRHSEPRGRRAAAADGDGASASRPAPGPQDHAAQVDLWMQRVPNHPPEAVIAALQESLTAVWDRAKVMLGEDTLAAVLDRVIHDAAMRFPVFAAIGVDAGGLRTQALASHVRPEDAQQLREGTRYILIQCLAVVGSLTAEILTPALRAALLRVRREDIPHRSLPQSLNTPAPLALMPEPAEESPSMIANGIPTLETGVHNLDLIMGRGIPKGSVTIVAGPPGSGKTILAQQFCFNNASAACPVLYFSTLSEPMAKTLRYMRQFSFFDPSKIDRDVHLVDLGETMRSENGSENATKMLVGHVKRVTPGIIVIDSFKSFDDINRSSGQMRMFGHQMAVQLMAWEATALLLGEYSPSDYETKPFFSIADGLIALYHEEESGEWQRFIQVHKMRGVAHNMDPHSFAIGKDGMRAFTPRINIMRSAEADRQRRETPRLPTGIEGLDEVIGEGIPFGSSVLLSGGPGTGKTVLLLDFIFQGAKAGEKGVLFSFEETPDRLAATARGLGWDLDAELKRGMVEIVFIPQPDIMLEADLMMIQEKVNVIAARRVAIDSVSVFLHKIRDARIAQEKIFQLATIVQNVGAVGFFATDIPYGTDLLSRLGIEETIVDGVILLTATENGFLRRRYLEVYKLRNTAHVMGRHGLVIEAGRVAVIPRQVEDAPPPPARPKNGRTAARE